MKWRDFIDFRRLNEINITISAYLPRMSDILEEAMKFRWFSKVDLIKVYWQKPLG